MGALYVKDAEAFAMAQELSQRRGLTKAAAVKLALANELAKDASPALEEPTLHEKLAEWRRTTPLRFDPAIVIDKAFCDSLNDEEED